MTFAQYATFSGRASRWEFWWFVAFCACLFVFLKVVDVIMGGALLSTLAFLVLLVPGIALTARRLHDMVQPAWWCLLYLVPLIGPLILLVWCAFAGTPGFNRYGAHPMDPDAFVVGAP